jgi:hypothetical protein
VSSNPGPHKSNGYIFSFRTRSSELFEEFTDVSKIQRHGGSDAEQSLSEAGGLQTYVPWKSACYSQPLSLNVALNKAAISRMATQFMRTGQSGQLTGLHNV